MLYRLYLTEAELSVPNEAGKLSTNEEAKKDATKYHYEHMLHFELP